eukprot:TRINITY_DN3533_c0_g1_i1.p1 TRINITY_DN3533_c0_g1~~TRINITY_DN3533_c0_g1_i1.p1  ORF type:complete len:555 (+),score=65.17 TRINITY_DN3533_c0_g1_i1:211-1875(+)
MGSGSSSNSSRAILVCSVLLIFRVFFVASYRGLEQEIFSGRRLNQNVNYTELYTFVDPVCMSEVRGEQTPTPTENKCADQSIGNLDADCIDEEVFNPIPASPGRYPYYVSLQQELDEGGLTRYRHFCGGALLAKDMFVTTAHCIFSTTSNVDFRATKDASGTGLLQAGAIQVALGPYCRHQKGVERVVAAEYFMHPNFTGVEYRSDDIALVKLSRPFNYEGKYPNYLSAQTTEINENSGIFTAMGHGAQNGDERNSQELYTQSVVPLGLGFLYYISVDQCNLEVRTVSPMFNILSDKMICLLNRNQDTCVGDSGSPVIIADGDSFGALPFDDPGQDILIGLTSWGPDITCAGGKLPGVYTRVGSYVDWIQKKLKTYSDYYEEPVAVQGRASGQTAQTFLGFSEDLATDDPYNLEGADLETEVNQTQQSKDATMETLPAPEEEVPEQTQEVPPPITEVQPKQPVFESTADETSQEIPASQQESLVPTPELELQVFDLPERCKLPKARGICEGAILSWYYDVNKQKCVDFDYGGCGGNDNNFRTLQACEAACVRTQ